MKRIDIDAPDWSGYWEARKDHNLAMSKLTKELEKNERLFIKLQEALEELNKYKEVKSNEDA